LGLQFVWSDSEIGQFIDEHTTIDHHLVDTWSTIQMMQELGIFYDDYKEDPWVDKGEDDEKTTWLITINGLDDQIRALEVQIEPDSEADYAWRGVSFTLSVYTDDLKAIRSRILGL